MQLLDINMLIINNLQDAERVLQTVPTNELFVVNDPELELVLLGCPQFFWKIKYQSKI